MAVLPSPETALQQHIKTALQQGIVVIAVLPYRCTHDVQVYCVHIRLSKVV